jgi:hypothetical protein
MSAFPIVCSPSNENAISGDGDPVRPASSSITCAGSCEAGIDEGAYVLDPSLLEHLIE